VLGPCLGAVGVGFASALAGHASATAAALFEARGDVARVRWWAPLDADEALLDSLLGVIIFKVGRQGDTPPAGFQLAPALLRQAGRPGARTPPQTTTAAQPPPPTRKPRAPRPVLRAPRRWAAASAASCRATWRRRARWPSSPSPRAATSTRGPA
jgi:hypothetical protein